MDIWWRDAWASRNFLARVTSADMNVGQVSGSSTLAWNGRNVEGKLNIEIWDEARCVSHLVPRPSDYDDLAQRRMGKASGAMRS
jgi:hypothetical protein